MTSLLVLLSCLAENLEWLWEKRLVFEACKNIFRTFQSCETVYNTSLRPEEEERWSWGLSSLRARSSSLFASRKPDWLYLLHPTGYHTSNNLRNARLLYGGNEFKTIKANSAAVIPCFQEKRESVTVSSERGHMQIGANWSKFCLYKPSKGVLNIDILTNCFELGYY